MKNVKIRTRIIFISCVMVLVATLMVTGILLWVTYKSMEKEASAEAYKNAYEIFADFKSAVNRYKNSENRDLYVQYYLKTSSDGQTICISNQEVEKEIYNTTVFSKEYILNSEYSSGDNGLARYIDYKGGKYIIFESDAIDIYRLYRIEDVSYVQNKIYRLIIYGAIIILAVFLITFVILAMLLRRQFKPLLELKRTTSRMAEGMYDTRVEVKNNDEVGQLGESFNRMAEAVEKRDNNLKMFMGNLTHELKTPMTAIMGYAQTMLTVNISENEKEEALMYICDECGRLERLSKKLMRLLEIENNGDKLELKRVSVEWLFAETKRITHSLLNEKNITLVCNADGGSILAEPDLMTDVMVNLVDNAVKASKDGGKIELIFKENVIQVRDYGCGIGKEEQEKILEPFYMVDKSRSRKNGGAGLGLALVAVILKHQNINLIIDSTPGQGTTVNLHCERLQFV